MPRTGRIVRMTILRPFLVAAAAVLAIAHAQATTVKAGKPAASQPAASAGATRAQLRDCLDTEAALKERFRVIEATTAAHEKLFDQIEAENTRLEQLHDQLDHDSEVAVKSFNALVKEHNEHVKQMNQDAVDARPAGDAYNADMVAFNHKCSGLRFHVEDMEVVTRERQKAAAHAAAASASL